MKILCADDNEWIGGLYRQILARAGHEVESVTNGQAAWELLANDLDRFGMVIVDYQMPWLNGLEIVQRLRREGYGGRIIVQSGFLTPEMERKFEGLKVDRIVHKPIGFQTITDLVAELT